MTKAKKLIEIFQVLAFLNLPTTYYNTLKELHGDVHGIHAHLEKLIAGEVKL